jgi:phosphoesterase RecJ-like protein
MAPFYPQWTEAFGRLLARLAGRTVAVIGHARPDGDCIGSQVALARLLQAAGSRAVCVNADAVPRRLGYLTRDTEFLRTDAALALPAEAVAVFVDCADHGRAGERLRARFPQPVGNLDHHLSNAGFADVDLIDGGSAATCELLAGLALDRNLALDVPTARALYAGILTDTGQFRFNSTTRRCFAVAGELVARGASPAEAGYELYERESRGKLELLQRFLASLRFECGGRVCIGALPGGIFAETGTSAEDTEGLVDHARCIDGVDVGVLVEERPDGGVKASLRAKDPVYRLDLVAGQFKGGGHACAAGLSASLDPASFRAALLAALAQRLREVDAAAATAAAAT